MRRYRWSRRRAQLTELHIAIEREAKMIEQHLRAVAATAPAGVKKK